MTQIQCCIREAAHSVLFAALACLACSQPVPGPILDLPPRAPDAVDGAEMAAEVRDLDLESREERIFE
jgi:hypothetical protein